MLALLLGAGSASATEGPRISDPLGDSTEFLANCRWAERLSSPGLTDTQVVQGLSCLAFVAGVFGAVVEADRYDAGDVHICHARETIPLIVVTSVVQRAKKAPDPAPGTSPRRLVLEAIGELFPCPRGK
ncbi:Rap1a/Tai family immunity protein [Cognatilysobacter lacus]|uniref:Rap1a/Tai family immunity protein n=1 Tax=Cognatilysobacter lacus TaxID=1643323 RepID=UPI003CCDEB48